MVSFTLGTTRVCVAVQVGGHWQESAFAGFTLNTPRGHCRRVDTGKNQLLWVLLLVLFVCVAG